MKMKKGTRILLLILAAALFSGCGGNRLFQGMSLKNTALLFSNAEDTSSFDVHIMYQEDEYKDKFLSSLSTAKAVPVDNWSFSDITFPLYGFYLNNSENTEKYYAWSNGILYTSDGKKYKFDFDSEGISLH